MEAAKAGAVDRGDTVLFLDGWNPAVTSVRYMSDVCGMGLKIVLVLHAGTWDPWDHLTQCGMGRWAGLCEVGWMLAAYRILVATNFHKELIQEQYIADDGDELEDKIRVTGFPLMLSELNPHQIPWRDKKKQVVFPHRLAKEKQPQMFDAVREIFESTYPEVKDVTWIRTQDQYTDKASLYRMLAESKVAFSAALQETWGIVQLESWYLGCWPVVPDRLSYQEIYPADHRYQSLEEAARMIKQSLDSPKAPAFVPGHEPEAAAWNGIERELRAL